MSSIESILFSTKKWTLVDAREWIKNHGMVPVGKQTITKNFIHLSINPGFYKRLRIKTIPSLGIEFRIGFV